MHREGSSVQLGVAPCFLGLQVSVKQSFLSDAAALHLGAPKSQPETGRLWLELPPPPGVWSLLSSSPSPVNWRVGRGVGGWRGQGQMLN